MKYKSLLITALTAGALGSSAFGAAVSLGNFDGPYPIINGSGDLVPFGTGYIAAGSFTSFDNSAIGMTVTPADAAALEADFNQFGDALTFNSNVSDGFFAGQAQVPNLSDATFVGKDVYLVIGDGSSIADSGRLYIVDSNLQFVADNPVAPNVVVRLNEILANGGELVLGSTVPGIVSPAGTTDGGQGAPIIPEPGVGILSALGVLGLALRRRRK